MKTMKYWVISLISMLLIACGGSGDEAPKTPENATFDNAAFDQSTWE